MHRLISTLFGLSACAAACLSPFSATAGEITREPDAVTFTWRPTDCRKPIHIKSVSETKQVSLQRYNAEITNYLICLQNEAQRDHLKAQMELKQAIEKKLEQETKIMDEMMKREFLSTR